MTEDECVELFTLFTTVCEERDIDGGTLLMRFGNTDKTVATVAHLHAQLVSGGARKDDTERIPIAIGYNAH